MFIGCHCSAYSLPIAATSTATTNCNQKATTKIFTATNRDSGDQAAAATTTLNPERNQNNE